MITPTIVLKALNRLYHVQNHYIYGDVNIRWKIVEEFFKLGIIHQ
jgi:hypothetical protein